MYEDQRRVSMSKFGDPIGFGKCPECGAIVSLDSTNNCLCDRCYQESQRVVE